MFNLSNISADDARLMGMALAHMQERITSVLANMQSQINEQQTPPATGEPIKVPDAQA